MLSGLLKRAFRASQVFPLPNTLKNISYSPFKNFSSEVEGLKSNTGILTKHRKELKKFNYLSTMMKPPTNIVKLGPKEVIS